jgi:hypothetical protein
MTKIEGFHWWIFWVPIHSVASAINKFIRAQDYVFLKLQKNKGGVNSWMGVRARAHVRVF